jgi:hypothetical protein
VIDVAHHWALKVGKPRKDFVGIVKENFNYTDRDMF